MIGWFHNLEVRQKILVGNSIAALILILFVLLIYLSTNQMLETTQWVSHTEEVIAYGHQLMEELLNMETGERGFLITGKKEFLEPYEKAQNDFRKTLDRTKILVSDNPAQVSNLEVIGRLADDWLKKAGRVEIW